MPYGDGEAEDRRQHQEDRLRVVLEIHDEIARAWMAEQMDDELLSAKGVPDLSVNTMLFNGRQMSALYDEAPDVAHADDSAAVLVGPGGFLDDSGFWSGQQWTQLIALTVGDCIRVPEVVEDEDTGELTFQVRHVYPSNVWVRAAASRTSRAVELWELRIRPIKDATGAKHDQYAWDVYRIDGAAPYYRVMVPGGTGDGGYEDKTQEVHGRTFEGPGYVWRVAGQPFIPHVFYSAVPDGYLLHSGYNRGAYHGCLNSILHWTGLNRSMACTMVPFVLTWGLRPPSAKTKGAGSGEATNGLTLTPGAIAFCAIDEKNGGVAPGVVQITPGPYLETLLKGATEYEVQQGGRWGAGESSAQKSGSSPWSGAALTISNHDRRYGQRKMRPSFERQDKVFLRNSAAVLMAWNLARDVPLTGYSITYHEIPLTPEEQQQTREQLDWEQTHGLISDVERYCRLPPGASKETAQKAIVTAALEQRRLNQTINDSLAAAGLAPPEDEDPIEPDENDPTTTTTPEGEE
jgi:hypothetical protein